MNQSPSLRGIVKVGLVAPFSGADYAAGYNALFGARLALREWNARGGPGGYRVELVALDEGGGPEAGQLQARKLALDPDVVGVVGHLDDESALAAAEEYRRAGMPAIGLGMEAGGDGYGGIRRLAAGPDDAAQAVAKMARQQLGTRPGSGDAAILASPAPSRQRLAGQIAGALEQQGLAISLRAIVPQTASEQHTLARQLRQREPSLIVLAGGSEAGSLVGRLRAAGVGSALLVGPLEGPALPEIAGRAAEGVYYFSLAAAPRDLPGAQDFVRRYHDLGDRDPWGIAALTYDATNLLLEAADRAAAGGPPTRARVSDGLVHLEDAHGLTGPITFDGQGRRQGAAVYFYRLNGPDFPGLLVGN